MPILKQGLAIFRAARQALSRADAASEHERALK
jgi:hypothetical protein